METPEQTLSEMNGPITVQEKSQKIMKRFTLFLLIIFILFVVYASSCQRELYETTDYFVNSLSTEYESYGMMGQNNSKTTENGLYVVFPFGRLINVKINKYVEDDKYEDLKKDLQRHYKNDTRVHDVYICQGGTIMIDCRN